MGTSRLAAAVLVLGVALGVLWMAQSGAQHFVPRLNLDEPPLARVAPVISPAGPPLSRRVVLVIIDGLGANAAHDLPALDLLRARGIDARARSHFPTLSRPNYSAMLTGIEPRWSGVRTNDYDHALPLDSLVARLQDAGRKSAYVADVSPALPTMLPGWDDVRLVPWRSGLRAASLSALEGDAALVVYLFDAVDRAGHRSGARSRAYREAALGYDELIGQLAARLDPARDTLIVVADHGHTAVGGHGGLERDVVEVPLVLAGAGIARGAHISDAQLADLAPTIAALLGVPVPGHALGRTLVEALALPQADRAALAFADGRRRAVLATGLVSPVADGLRRAGELVGARVEAAVGVAALLILLGVFFQRRGVLSLRRSVVLAAGGSLIITAAGICLVFADCLSSPSVPGGEAPFARFALLGAGLAIAHLGLALAVARSTRADERSAAVLGVALAGALLATLFTGAANALSGAPLATRFFDPAAMIALPLLWSAGLFQAGAAACVALFETFVLLRPAPISAEAPSGRRAAW